MKTRIPHTSLLLLGYSDFAKRVILPAIAGIPDILLAGIASRSRYKEIPHGARAFRSYEEAIHTSGADTVYISLHNSAHSKWISYALTAGKRVICDKPSFLSARDAVSVTALARKHHLVLAESLQFLFHRQHRLLKEALTRARPKKLTMTVHFGFPALPSGNFRNNSRLGGGCIADIGPYLIGTGHFYTGHYPKNVFAVGTVSTGGIVDHAVIVMQFEGGHMLTGDIGFGRQYDNHLEIWGGSFHADLPRAFAIKPQETNRITIRTGNRNKVIPVPKDDAMRNFFTHFLRQKHRKASGSDDIAYRAIALDAIYKSFKNNRWIPVTYET